MLVTLVQSLCSSSLITGNEICILQCILVIVIVNKNNTTLIHVGIQEHARVHALMNTWCALNTN